MLLIRDVDASTFNSSSTKKHFIVQKYFGFYNVWANITISSILHSRKVFVDKKQFNMRAAALMLRIHIHTYSIETV